MTETELQYKKSKFPLWLIRISLLFSVFAFSGYNENIESAFQESTQTEMLFSKKANLAKSLVAFKKAFKKLFEVLCPNVLKQTEQVALEHYNQRLQITYKSVSGKALSCKGLLLNYQIKAFLPTSNDDVLNPAIG